MKKFAMSMYPNELALYKAKAEYFEEELTRVRKIAGGVVDANVLIIKENSLLSDENDRLNEEVESLSEIIEWSGVDVGEILSVMKQ